MSVQLDLEFHYGENWIIQYECNDGNGNDINLTGAALEWGMATLNGSPVMTRIIGDGLTLTNALEGEVTLSVTPFHQSDAGITESTSYRYEFRVTTAAGTVAVQAKGMIAVLPSMYA
jgi:hypothetical protein